MAKNHSFFDEISGIEHLGEIPEKHGEYRIGEGLINDAARAQADVPVTMIEYMDLFPCPKNAKLSKPQEKIEALADSIAREGLLAPLVVVRRENGKYEILSGETRYLAIGLLRERGAWNKNDLVEAFIFDTDSIDIPLSREMKEDYARRTANIARDKTADDYYVEINEWRDMIEELRRNGVESLPMPGTDGKDAGIRIAGEKTADIIAKIVGLSSAQVKQYLAVRNAGSRELQDALMGGSMSAKTAADAARTLSKKEQAGFAKEARQKKTKTGKGATQNDLKAFKNKSEEERAKEEEEPSRWVEYDKDHFYEDLRVLFDFFDADPSPMFYMSAAEHKRVLKQMAALEELFAKYMEK